MKKIKDFGKMLGFLFIKIIGLSLLIGGATEEIVWAMLVGFLIVDLSPSFVKTVWKDAEATYKTSKMSEKSKEKLRKVVSAQPNINKTKKDDLHVKSTAQLNK